MNTTNNKPKANWIKSITVGPDIEVKVSDKGYIGVWSRGKYACGMYASILQALSNNPECFDLASFAVETFEATRPAREEAKLKAKLTKEAEALLAKAERLQQAGIDLASIIAKKQG